MCCCNKVISIGCFPVCSELISTKIIAAKSGAYKLKLDYLDVGISTTEDFEMGDIIIVPIPDGGLMANYEYKITIFDPDGLQVLDTSGNDCFVFTATNETLY